MDSRDEARLLKLMDEVSTGESENSEPEPFSSDDDVLDPSYTAESEYSTDSENSPVLQNIDSENTDIRNLPEHIRDENLGANDNDWVDDIIEIPQFAFDDSISGQQDHFENTPTAMQCFEKLWDRDIMGMLVSSMNIYAEMLQKSNRPHRKNTRYTSIKPTNMDELKHFLALCIAQGQIKYPSIRKMFSMNPLYYSPIFHYKMSGRRYEELLRVFSCSYGEDVDPTDKLNKISTLLNKLLRNFQSMYYPSENLSLDESLLLFRGRLSFRQYIKGKRARYGIKFYSLCTTDGYVLNMQIYKGKTEESQGMSKLEALVFSLMEPYLDRGHHLFMDNFYNSVDLSNKLLKRKTHTTGTLRSNRRGNPKEITKQKLKKGEHKWQRSRNVYVSKWKDKREVLCITTKYHPKLIDVRNRFGHIKVKPEEVAKYNDNMSGVDRNDQMVSYYSSPRKSVRWYKKVMFHLLDITIWNSYFIMRKYNTKLTLLEYREQLIKEFLDIPHHLNDGRKIMRTGPIHGGKRIRVDTELNEDNDPSNTQSASLHHIPHFPDNIPNPKDPNKSHHMRCRQCAKNHKRKETKYLCKTCINKPPLCIVPCFELYHKNL